jgi:hypothetical protein
MLTKLTPTEIMMRGRAIYDDQIKPIVELQYRDKLVMIDIVSGDYEIGTDLEQFDLSSRLRARHPDGELCCLRIGSRAIYSLGGTL